MKVNTDEEETLVNTVDIFTAGLGLTEPWYVSDVQLIPSEESHELELHISVDFERGAKFNVLDDDGNVLCDANGQPLELKATDTVERTWRHLNFEWSPDQTHQYKNGNKTFYTKRKKL